MSPGVDADVLVIGYGPVGVVVSGLLARQGRLVQAVDRDLDLFPLPRAAHFDQEILRILQQLGCADEIARSTRPTAGMDFLTADRRVLLSMRTGAVTPSGWPATNMFHQPDFERTLRGAAAAQGVDARLGTEIVALEDHPDHVGVRTSAGETIRAAYVIACDGARSTVRKLLDIGVHDLGFEEPWLVLDLVIRDAASRPSDVALQVCDPARPHTLVPMPEPRFRFEFMLLPGEDPAWIQRPDVVRELLSGWLDPSRAEIERSAVYTFHGLVAREWRRGRVLLAGDAAHQMPPFLGQGMCSGMRDAANLAWKLDRVLRGRAPDALLDSYQAEREPHVRAIVEAAVGVGRMICTTDAEVAARRDAAMLAGADPRSARSDAIPMPPLLPGPLVLGGGGRQAIQVVVDGKRLDDVIGPRFAVVTRRESSVDPAPLDAWRALGALVLDACEHPELIAALDAADADVLVIRPDRYLLSAGPEPPAPPPLIVHPIGAHGP